MGFWELVVVAIVALVVLGPDKLPTAIRATTRWVRTVKQFGSNVQAEFNEQLRIHELHNHLKQAELHNMENLSPEVQRSIDELKAAARSVNPQFEQPSADDATVNPTTSSTNTAPKQP